MSFFKRDTTSSLMSMIPVDSFSNDTVLGFDWPLPIATLNLEKKFNFKHAGVRNAPQPLLDGSEARINKTKRFEKKIQF